MAYFDKLTGRVVSKLISYDLAVEFGVQTWSEAKRNGIFASEIRQSQMKHALVAIVLSLICCLTPVHADTSILPAGMVVETEFKAGPGKPVGKVELVQGRVVVAHKGKQVGYNAMKDLPVYKGDTIYTMKKGRVRMRFNDGSILTLASATKLVINAGVYAPAKKERMSFFNMVFGKARFVVKKLTKFKRSEVSVKTKTAILGVRGSDFVVRADDRTTEVSTLDKTVLEIRSLAAIEMKPTILRAFERVIVEFNELPAPVEKITEGEMREMLRELTVMPAVAVRDERISVRREDVGKDEDEQAGSEEAPETGEPYVEEAEPHPEEGEPETEEGEPYPEEAEPHVEEAEVHVEEAEAHVEETEPHFEETELHVEEEIQGDIEQPLLEGMDAVGLDANMEALMEELPSDQDISATDIPIETELVVEQQDTQVDTDEIQEDISDIQEEVFEMVRELPPLPDPPQGTCN